MKNIKLVLLLSIFVLNIFAQSNHDARKLYNHLVAARQELLELVHANTSIPESENIPEFEFGIKVMDEFYNSSVELQQVFADLNKDALEVLYHMGSLERASKKVKSNIYNGEIAINEDTKSILYVTFEPIYNKYHQEFCAKYGNTLYHPDSPFANLIAATAKDVFEEILDIMLLHGGTPTQNALVNSINSKIQELEEKLLIQE